jgi:hypothetical protein
MTQIEDKDFITYPEYKLFCYSKMKKPLKKESIGQFIETSNLNSLFDNENNLFSIDDIGEFKKYLFSDGNLNLQKVTKMSLKLGFDETELLPIFEIKQGIPLSEDEFKDFVKNI